MPLLILRMLFIVVAAGLAVSLVQSRDMPEVPTWLPWALFIGILGTSVVIIVVDMLVKRKALDVISSVYLGLIVGLFLAYVVGLALIPLPMSEFVRSAVRLVLALVICYVCISLLMQTRNDFRFIIPYVEFSKEVKGLKPFVLDTSVVIDGRIADVVETRVIDNQLIMPQFVIAELQAIADSNDKLRRNRGRRGLDILNRLRSDPKVGLMIFDRDLPEFAGQPVD